MIEPYKRHPEPPLVALLTPDGDVLGERGDTLNLERLPDGYRVWCDYETARSLVSAGRGEALCWNGEEIRWRHERFEDEWKRRPTDVHVLRLPFPESHEQTLGALARWRDWLAGYGAAPIGTTGSAAWSLLRARLERPLGLSFGSPPPLLQTLGGRQELGPAGQGRFEGALTQLDLPAAYASELGGLRYGGRWHEASGLPTHAPDWWARENRCVFVRAIVNVPDLQYGPLPRRPRRRVYGFEATMLGAYYPAPTRIQGVWTWQELESAEAAGCRIMAVLETWVHLAGERTPFAPWWAAIVEGRRMRGLAGLLAKTTGNALWGQFCMDSRFNGTRSIRSKVGKRTSQRRLKANGGRPPAHDLAETVSGRVRARLVTAMLAAGDDLLSAHTDGIWCRADRELLSALPAWRRKEDVRRLDLIGPQQMRIYPLRGSARVVYAGATPSEADRLFDETWAREGLAA